MQNHTNVDEAIKHLEQEVQRETHELHEKEEELRRREQEEVAIKQEIPSLQREMEAKKHQLYEHGVAIPKLKAEIAALRRAQLDKHSELLRVQKSYQETLRKSSIKLR